MKSYSNFIYPKNKKILLLLAIIFPFIPLNTIAKGINTLTNTTSIIESKKTTTSNIDITTTTSSLSTPTTTENVYLCPLSFIFEGDQYQQNLLKEFRDEVLAKQEKGLAYTNLYYINSPEITLIILSNQDINTHAKKILIELLPVVKALLKKGEAELSQQLIDEIDALLNEIAHKASSQLREAIKMAKSEIIKKEIFKELGFKITK